MRPAFAPRQAPFCFAGLRFGVNRLRLTAMRAAGALPPLVKEGAI
jgi:hypothetical protein